MQIQRRRFIQKSALTGIGLLGNGFALSGCSSDESDDANIVHGKTENIHSTTEAVAVDTPTSTPNIMMSSNEPNTVVATDSTVSQIIKPGQQIMYRPPKGKMLMTIGQLKENIQDYFDHFESPPCSLHLVTGGMDKPPAPWDVKGFLQQPKAQNSAIFLSMDWVPDFFLYYDMEGGLANNEFFASDASNAIIDQWADWCKSIPRPIYFRMGAEVNRWPGFYYDSKWYKKAFRHIVERFRARGVTNCSFGMTTVNTNNVEVAILGNREMTDLWNFDLWYPGDDVVDWLGFSMFLPYDPDTVMMKHARIHNKPVAIVESSALRINIGKQLYFPYFVGYSEAVTAKDIWRLYFEPMDQFFKANIDIIFSYHYIYQNWSWEELWSKIFYFTNSDARIHLIPELKERWEDWLRSDLFMQNTPNLYSELGYNPNL